MPLNPWSPSWMWERQRRQQRQQQRTVPPPGSYDPDLDAQRRAAERGFGYLQQDTELANARAAQDYGFGMEDLTRSRDRGLFDLTRDRDRGFEDLDTQLSRGNFDLDRTLTRGTEDYNRDVRMLGRQYSQLATRQAEGARAAGVMSGGLALKAQAIRAENQAIDREPLDTNFRRLGEDVGTSRTRLGEDVGRQRTRLGQDFDTMSGRLTEDFNVGSGRLTVGYGRGVFDRGTALTRAGQENTQFGLDLDAQRLYEAGQAGWVPEPRAGGGAGGGGGGRRVPIGTVRGEPVMGAPWQRRRPFQPSWRY